MYSGLIPAVPIPFGISFYLTLTCDARIIFSSVLIDGRLILRQLLLITLIGWFILDRIALPQIALTLLNSNCHRQPSSMIA